MSEADRVVDAGHAMYHGAVVAKLERELKELRAKFTRLDQPRYSGAPMLDAVLGTPNPEFRTWVDSLPPTYWARYDLSAARIGWEAKSEQTAQLFSRLDAYIRAGGMLCEPTSVGDYCELGRNLGPCYCIDGQGDTLLECLASVNPEVWREVEVKKAEKE